MVTRGYQYNLKRQLVPVGASHRQDQFKNPKIRFNLYGKGDRTFRGQVSLLPWQDGATIICSVLFDPRQIFAHYFTSLKVKGIVLRGSLSRNIWFSSILPIKEDDFIKYSENVHPELMSVRDSEDDNPPPVKI
jgi:uncharacterized protein (DUF2147 family)